VRSTFTESFHALRHFESRIMRNLNLVILPIKELVIREYDACKIIV
jgi:hypothetical protein